MTVLMVEGVALKLPAPCPHSPEIFLLEITNEKVTVRQLGRGRIVRFLCGRGTAVCDKNQRNYCQIFNHSFVNWFWPLPICEADNRIWFFL